MKFTKLVEDIRSTKLLNTVSMQFKTKVYTVESNNAKLIEILRAYFQEWVTSAVEDTAIVITAWECEIPEFDLDFTEYKESPEKRVKEVYADIESFRLVKKTKTGVHFAIGREEWLALGPLCQYSNQLINFVNAIFMEINLQEEALLFHAAGVAKDGEGIVIAAQSGKGKSTTSLLLMNNGLDFVSNDRVILRKESEGFEMIGVPKHPRVNPGTLLNNPKVKHLLKSPERFEGKSKEEIWQWEEKYDVMIPDVYGASKFPLSAKAKAFLIIDWGDSEEEVSLEEMTLASRPDLMPAIMKKPSLMTPRIHEEHKDHEAQDYLRFLEGLPVYILQGKIDPQQGLALIMSKFF